MNQWLEDFRQTIDSASPRLLQISEAQSEQPRAEDHWSSKQIIGHLIDSAANNHARFVLGQIKDDLVFRAMTRIVGSNQHYQQAAWPQSWSLAGYNLHLLHMMSHASQRR